MMKTTASKKKIEIEIYADERSRVRAGWVSVGRLSEIVISRRIRGYNNNNNNISF